MSQRTQPLFPLGTVLFPGGPLSLRIFEPRYVDMVGRCMREGSEFGVLLIAHGDEIGAVESLARVGTSARIVDFSQLPDGLLGLMCRGARRFELLERSTRPDGLHVGWVRWPAPAPPAPLPAEQQPLARLLAQVLRELGDSARFLEPDYADSGWVADRLAELMPLSRGVQQSLLETEDPRERLARLVPLIEVPPEDGAGGAGAA